MTRLDVRVKTELPVWINHYKLDTEKAANASELSLSGLLIDGWTNKIHDTCLIKLVIPKSNEVELVGEIIRINNSGLAARFYLPERETMVRLWEFIGGRINHLNGCPYCTHVNKPYSGYCEKCGWYLNFKDREYLDKHMKETFLQRITSRIGSLNSEHLFRVLNLIDRELLVVRGRPMDEQFVGTCEAMLEVFSMIRKVAPTDNSILILGESGTGKDLTARAIHERSQRASSPFVVINCAAIPENLLEAELFGYERGAFTGAYMSKKGKFELADKGTVFLDELAELPLPLQAKLLRVLEDKIVERVGGKSGRKVDIRLIAATNKNLEQEVMDKRFRLDLYHRINTFTITLPSLRDMGEDKLVIAKYYLARFCAQEGVRKQFSKKAIEAINVYPWPGNVRELINKIRRAIVVSETNIITPVDLSLEVPEEKQISSSLRELRAHIDKQKLIETLQMTSHNINKTARLLGVSRPTIYAFIKKYDLES
jgi:transcriptional regulator with PAS, ATPase and Fis domain